MSFVQLKDLLPKAASKYQLQGELKAAMVVNRASTIIKDIFSEGVSSHIRVKRFKEGVLWIAVSNSSVAQEVHFKSFVLQKELNESLRERLVIKIRSFQENFHTNEYS